MMTKEEFADECKFAKVVYTPTGAALLVAGMVVEVKGPIGGVGTVTSHDLVHGLVIALRQGSSDPMVMTASEAARAAQ